MEAIILSNYFKTNLYNLLNTEEQNKVYVMNNFLHICGLNLKISEIKYKELSDMCLRSVDENNIKNIYEKLSKFVNSKKGAIKKSNKKPRKSSKKPRKSSKKPSIKRTHSMRGGGVKFIEYLKKINKIFTDNIDKGIFENIKDTIEQTKGPLINEIYLRDIIGINKPKTSVRGGSYNRFQQASRVYDDDAPPFIQLICFIIICIFLLRCCASHGGSEYSRWVGSTRASRSSAFITIVLCFLISLLCSSICIKHGFFSEDRWQEFAIPFQSFCFKTLIQNEELQSDFNNLESIFRRITL